MYNIYCDNINTLGYDRKQNAYIVLLLEGGGGGGEGGEGGGWCDGPG